MGLPKNTIVVGAGLVVAGAISGRNRDRRIRRNNNGTGPISDEADRIGRQLDLDQSLVAGTIAGAVVNALLGPEKKGAD